MSQAILYEIEVRSPKAEDNHEGRWDLERVSWLQERFEKKEGTLSSHGHGTNGDCSYCKKEETQKPANTLSPGKSDAWILK